MEELYFDNAATTPMSPAVIEEFDKQMQNAWGNASTGYLYGRRSKRVLEDSRHVIAKSINARDDEIVFTSGGTESDNTAVMQTALARQNLGKHIITTSIEHEAILRPLEALEKRGFKVTYLPVDQYGNISLDDFKAALDDDTILVTIMMGNNEVGSRMPIHEIGEILKDHQAWFHTDAVQTYGLLPIDVERDHIDMLSTSAHKINGPKKIGFLYRRRGINFPSFIKGGDQEEKRRAGTENVPAAAAFAKAVEALTPDKKAARQKRFYGFQKQLVNGLKEKGVDFDVNGKVEEGDLEHVINLWIKGVGSAVLQTNMDLNGVALSGGSACTAGSLEPSHVLKAMFGADSPRLDESIRISFGAVNTADQVDQLVDKLAKVANRLQKED